MYGDLRTTLGTSKLELGKHSNKEEKSGLKNEFSLLDVDKESWALTSISVEKKSFPLVSQSSRGYSKGTQRNKNSDRIGTVRH